MPYATEKTEPAEKMALLEALLFLSGKALSHEEISRHTGWSQAEIEDVAEKLGMLLEKEKQGLVLLRVAGGYQLATRPDLYEKIKWLRTETTDLSPMSLEVLAIVAFKQPITRAEIEKLRGVSSERILSSLVQMGLVVDLGRKDSPGRPILYGTSAYFLECIGMDSLADLAGHVPADTEQANGRTTAESNE